MSDAMDGSGISARLLTEWTQTFVRHPSPQTELFEHDPQIQSIIADTVIPLVKRLGLDYRRSDMGNLIIEIGPKRTDRGLMLMAYAMTHPANRMKSPFAGARAAGQSSTSWLSTTGTATRQSANFAT